MMTSLAWVVLDINAPAIGRLGKGNGTARGLLGHPAKANVTLHPSYARYATLRTHRPRCGFPSQSRRRAIIFRDNPARAKHGEQAGGKRCLLAWTLSTGKS